MLCNLVVEPTQMTQMTQMTMVKMGFRFLAFDQR
jgi:hypothetical protein